MIAKMRSCERSDHFVKRSRDLNYLDINFEKGLAPLIFYCLQQKTHGQPGANEISSI